VISVVMALLMMLSPQATESPVEPQTYYVVERVVEMEVTAYAPFDNVSGICNDGTPNTTSTGTVPRHETVAVNPKQLPYGTQMMIPGHGYGIAEDTGGALRKVDGKIKIDIYMDSYAEAIQWGRQTLMVTIYKEVTQ